MVDGITEVQPHILERIVFDERDGFRHAVEERFAADEAGGCTRRGMRREMFAAAEADFEPEIFNARC